MLLGFGGKGLDDTRGYLKHLTPPGPNKCRQEKLFLQTAALLLLQELHTLGVSLAQPFHVVLLVHLVAATKGEGVEVSAGVSEGVSEGVPWVSRGFRESSGLDRMTEIPGFAKP